MRRLTQLGWFALQVAAIAPWIVMWAHDTDLNRPGLHVPVLLGVVTAFVLTATIVGLLETWTMVRRWRQRG